MPSDDTTDIEQRKEDHRLGTINRWDAPDGDWAAEHDWTRYRGPPPWPVPGGWVFKDPEGGGWWQYFGEAGVGHHRDDGIRDELEADDSVTDPYDELEELRGEYAMLSAETANPDEVSLRNPEDEQLEWTLKIADEQVFRRVEPERPDLMAAVAEALQAFHDGTLDEQRDEIVPTSGRKPDDVLEEEELERRQEENESLDRFIPDGGVQTHPGPVTPIDEHPLPLSQVAAEDFQADHPQFQDRDQPLPVHALHEQYVETIAEHGDWELFEVHLYGYEFDAYAWNSAGGYGFKVSNLEGDLLQLARLFANAVDDGGAHDAE